MSLYSQHAANWKSCRACNLCETRKTVVLARGTVPCDMLFVGEAPGASENVLGKPFVGPAGKLLDKIIAEALQERCTFAFTNLVACIPLGDDGEKTKEPSLESIQACSSRLQEFIDLCRPKVIVAVGLLSQEHLVASDELPVVSIYHPAGILRADVSQRGLMIQKCVVTLSDALEDYCARD